MKLAVILAAYVPLALLRGWVISLLWGWYVTDYFGVRSLDVTEGVGLGILVSLSMSRSPTKEDEERHWAIDLAHMMLFPLIALAFGWAWSFVR